MQGMQRATQHIVSPEERASGSAAESERTSAEYPGNPSVGAALCAMTDRTRETSTSHIESSNVEADRYIRAKQHKRVLMATAIVNVKTTSGDLPLRILLLDSLILLHQLHAKN